MKKIIALLFYCTVVPCKHTLLAPEEVMQDADQNGNLMMQHMQAQDQARAVAQEFANEIQRRQENFGARRLPQDIATDNATAATLALHHEITTENGIIALHRLGLDASAKPEDLTTPAMNLFSHNPGKGAVSFERNDPQFTQLTDHIPDDIATTKQHIKQLETLLDNQNLSEDAKDVLQQDLAIANKQLQAMQEDLDTLNTNLAQNKPIVTVPQPIIDRYTNRITTDALNYLDRQDQFTITNADLERHEQLNARELQQQKLITLSQTIIENQVLDLIGGPDAFATKNLTELTRALAQVRKEALKTIKSKYASNPDLYKLLDITNDIMDDFVEHVTWMKQIEENNVTA